ncbi:Glutathione synthase/Ribosomal protein S6 modification enzyme (glutaminyl transferase) [Corynebacterium renale]|uniref:Glutathione synthase/RimK-type ligase-like ATP-grasp enzyme n=1 Tax=Corynebacterium renale TaxID=1724 RepID=A0A2A9DL66_9CORY|nr:Cj0069 family protein [Corynebacterium renale]PFG27121.1 glutathione synthase/RimK-type ligase-like ATP-grasp enzyme [Corynebacterium renale]SQG64149.1 Glutathione synthase/Ribosomal protein S6 modification enzyme (glutaminyl transferase) [Corynebacterium renale]SQI24075.1 Glutathione synthase/Ribosomal protein S6 modification enzyme (glutaminyl transferase) [Corynebacterium renale]STC94433.1 Glutathione synthase/Ribosomal protein S6 modification enzyme (glutaminyl transferase) [Corynebacter
MKKAIVVFEVEGGSDKFIDGHRKDTMPIVNAIKAEGWDAEVVYYRPEWSEKLFEYVSENFDAYISRVNPGNIPGGEKGYFELLTKLADAGLVGMSTPAEMMAYGAKDALVKLNDTSLVPADTAAYYEVKDFHETFPKSLSYGERVLKQNRGSTGEGIWRVRLADPELAASVEPGTALPLDTKLKCTEAVDNHTEDRELGEFMDFCDQYIIGDNGMLVDMRFMPRIVEGEIRILLVGPHPVFVVHKKPAEGGDNFSATLFSGAKYTYDKPEQWQELIDMFHEARPIIAEKLGGDNIPLIWTADFMLADGENGEDTYVLGEINCSCVGFTSELDMGIQELVASEAIKRVEAKHA